MRFEDKELKTTFEVPDRLTPRQALRYSGVVDFDPDKSMYERLWPGACVLIENWQSEYVPEAKPDALDLEGDYPQEYLDVIKWASLAVFSFVRRRQQVEKKLIRAAVSCAENADAPPPPEWVAAWPCQKWGCLPEAGGYLDQDYGLMQRMSVLSNIYNTVIRLRNMKGAQIHQLTTPERRVIKWLLDEGLLNNG